MANALLRISRSPPTPPPWASAASPPTRAAEISLSQEETAQDTAQELPAMRPAEPPRVAAAPAVRSRPPPPALGPPSPEGLLPRRPRPRQGQGRPGHEGFPRTYGGIESPGRAKECRETPGKGVVWASPRLPGLLNTATPPSRRRLARLDYGLPGRARTPTRPALVIRTCYYACLCVFSLSV